MVKCLECGNEFKQITNRHLKFSHNLTTIEYKHKYPNAELFDKEILDFFKERSKAANKSRKGIPRSNEVREKIKQTKSNQIIIPWNKGIPQQDDVKQKLKEKAKERHAVWKQMGIHPQIGKHLSDKTKERISKSVSDYYAPMVELKKQKNRFKKISKKFNKLCGYYQNANKSNVTILSGWNNPFIKCSCNKCDNIFYRTIQAFQDAKVRIDLCDACRITPKHSKEEIELLQLIRNYDKETRCGARNIIFPLEIDIYSEKFNLGIEYCGLYWHSELQGKISDYHLNKLKLCQDQNIKLITIFEDEYKLNKPIVLSRIKNILGITDHKLYARNCELKELSSIEANKFLNINHLQGAGRSNVRIGLFYQKELVSVMTFLRGDISKNVNDWELNRFASKLDYNVVGGASKLFTYFTKNYKPKAITTFSDRRWGEGNFYTKLGFEFSHVSPPNYWYISGLKRLHRYSLRKNINDNPELTEWENRKIQGWNRIWDCGTNVFIWQN